MSETPEGFPRLKGLDGRSERLKTGATIDGSDPYPSRRKWRRKGKGGSQGKWRAKVLKRYAHRCLICGHWSNPDQGAPELAAHHVIFKSQSPKRLHTDVRNGVALCHWCHTRLHNGDATIDSRRLLLDTIEMFHEVNARVVTGVEGEWFDGR